VSIIVSIWPINLSASSSKVSRFLDILMWVKQGRDLDVCIMPHSCWSGNIKNTLDLSIWACYSVCA